MSARSSLFRFKHFSVEQQGCAMRINTDGVLLGAMADLPGARRILDIGAGTGVIALMLAQRFPEAQVEAVELDESAAQRAASNFVSSPFAGRMTLHHADIRTFSAAAPFDLIVSNPPFFSNDLKNPDPGKQLARHAAEGFFAALFARIELLLNEKGCFWLIMPAQQSAYLIGLAQERGLFCVQRVAIRSDHSKPVIREILVFSRQGGECKASQLEIYAKAPVYSPASRGLLADFLLAL